MKKINFTKASEHLPDIIESLTFETEVAKNRIWYRGDPAELDQFFKATANNDVAKSRFWAAVPTLTASIRKYHSGLPAEIVDKLVDIITGDLDTVSVDATEDPDGTGELVSPAQELWEEIEKDNRFYEKVFPDALKEMLIAGDGAFKLSLDPDVSDQPIIEFYSGASVEYEYKRGRLQAIVFLICYTHEKNAYTLRETYSKGSIEYELFKDEDIDKKTPIPLSTIPELAGLNDYTFKGDFIAAVPLMLKESPIYKHRGASLFHGKSDNFDGLDEIVSQWIDGIRQGRVKNYIPEDLIPKDPNTGQNLSPNPFDNMFISRGASMKETAEDKIDQVQAQINYVAYMESYAAMLDMCLQGIMSPATLGIDLKRTDNALAQREKEKTTLYTRGSVLDVLNEVLPQLINTTLKVYENLTKTTVTDHEVSVQFGEYASPDFNEKVAVVGQARSFGIMSLEKAISELYGDTLTDEEKQEEIDRIREELHPTEEPALRVDGLDEDDEGDEE